MSLTSSAGTPQPSLAWQFEGTTTDYVTSLVPSSQVSPGPAQLQGSAALVTNAPTSNTAVSFPGTNGSYMLLNSTPATFDLATSNLFVECWVYFNSLATQYQCIVADGPTGSGASQECWVIRINPSNTVDFFINTPAIKTATSSTVVGTGQWYHISASYNSVGSIGDIFVNGGTPNSVSAVTPKTSSGASLVLGAYPSPSSGVYMNGYIRDLRVVQGGVVPVATFTPGAAPFSYASPSYVANMGTTVFTLLGQFVTYNPSGKYNTSLVMGGTSYLKFSKTLGYNLGTGGATFAMWFKLLAIPTGNFWIFGASGTSYNDRIYILVGTTGLIGWTFIDNTLAGKALNSPSNLVVGAWTHLTFTLFNGTMTMYINGAQVATRSDAPMSGVVLDTQFSIAALAGGSGNNINAEYDDLRIFDRALTSTQVQSIYNQQGMPGRGVAQVSSGTSLPLPIYISSNVSGTNITGSTLKPFSPFGYGSIYLNTDPTTYITWTAATLAASTNFTLETWANYKDFTGVSSNWSVGKVPCLFNDVSTTTLARFYFGATTAGTVGLYYWNNSQDIFAVSSSTIAVNTWNHLALTYDGTTYRIFINGVLAATNVKSGGGMVLPSGLRIGSHKLTIQSPNANVRAYITSSRFVTGAIVYPTSSTTIGTSIFTPPTAPLTTYSSGTTTMLLNVPAALLGLTGTPLFSQLSQDATSSAVGAFSLRAVNGTSVKAVQVRNGTTSATQDFYADRLGNLLTAPVVGQSLADWLGGATGYVTTWYDQSGRGNHATQATAANQPIIQRATKGPGYSCLFNGTTTQLVSTLSGSLDSTNYTICSASRRQAAGEMYYIGTNGPSSSRQQLSAGYYTDTTTILNEYAYALVGVTIPGYSSGAEPTGYDYSVFSQTNGMYIYNWRSGTSYASGNSGLTLPMTSSGNILLGYAPWNGANKYFSGEIFELTIFKTSLFDLSGSTPGTYTTPPSIIQSIYQNQLSYTGT